MSDFFILDFIDPDRKASSFKGTTYNSDSEEIEQIFNDGVSLQGKLKLPFLTILDDRRSTVKAIKDRIYFRSNAGGVWLISKKAKVFLDSLNLPLEFFPINIKGKKTEIENYFLVNVIGKIKCVDFEKSDVDYNKEYNYIEWIDSLSIDESKVPPETDVFLLGEYRAMFVIVSSRIKEAIEEEGLSGFVFRKPEEYSFMG